MKVIILKDHVSKPKTLSIKRSWVYAIPTLFVCFCIGMVYLGKTLAEKHEANIALQNIAPVQLTQKIEQERENLEELKVYLKNNLNALSAKIGGLQAQVSRINAVEKRLANVADIDINAFDFSAEPAQGGDQSLDIGLTPENLLEEISNIESVLSEREAAIKALDVSLSEIVLKEKQTPQGMPVENGWISSPYGWRISPVTGKQQYHKGVDIPARTGTDVIAVADGIVTKSDKEIYLGNVIEINHGDGMRTLYAHNSKNLVTVGTSVKKGEVIAEVGSTGRSTGPHVHFQVMKDGKIVNPKPFIQ